MKKTTYTTLATLVLSALVLTACGQKTDQAVSIPASSSQVSKQVEKTATSSSAKKAVTSKASQSAVPVASSVTVTSAASSQPASETVSSQVSETPLASSAIAPETAPSSQAVAEAPVVSQEVAPVATIEGAVTSADGYVPPVPVSPGAAAGQWGNFTINADGTMSDGVYVIVETVVGESGVLYMNATQPVPFGTGLYYHYYPAGVAIPFENFADPTDLSRERLIGGTGGYLDTPAEFIERVHNNVIYR